MLGRARRATEADMDVTIDGHEQAAGDPQAPARRTRTRWAFGALVALALGALGWFTIIGTTSTVAATASSSCHGAFVTANEVHLPAFDPVRSIETQEWGEVRITHRLFRADHFEFVAPGQPAVGLQVAAPRNMGYSCPG